MLAASAITLSLLGVTGIGVTSIVAPQAVAAALRDPASLLAKRSPGLRGLALLQTKHKPAPPAAPSREHAQAPEESKQEPAPVFALIEPGVDMPPIVYDDTPGSVTEQGLPPGAEIEVPPPGIEGPGGADFVPLSDTPGGGGGGGGGATTIIETPGVPEPSVWAMLITGFFAIGAALRAQRRARRLADGPCA